MTRILGGERRALLVAVAGLALVAILGYRPEPPAGGDTFSIDDVRPGGYAAFAELLERQGMATGRFVERTVELDRSVDTLVSAPLPPPVVPMSTRVRGDAEDDALAAWVRAGGRLVQIGPVSSRVASPPLGPSRNVQGPLAGPLAAQVRRLPGEVIPIVEARGKNDRVLLRSTRGALVVRRRLGRGEIVAFGSASIFANRNLGTGDAARLAVALATPRRPGGRVLFDEAVHGEVRDRAWWQALPVPTRIALGFAAFAAALGLAGGMLRLGPPLPPPPPPEPTSAAFVAALAALYRRVGARAHARDLLARATTESVRRRAKGDDEAAAATLASAPVDDDAALVDVARRAHALRREGRDVDGKRGRGAVTGGRRARHRR